MRNVAISLNYKLNEYGLFNNITKKYIKCNTEEEIFNKLNMKYLNPNERNIPSILVYDSNGRKVDRKDFLTGWCGRDYDYLELQYLMVNRDYTFTSIDTAYTYTMNPETDKVIDTIKSEISRKDFFINSDGKVINK